MFSFTLAEHVIGPESAERNGKGRTTRVRDMGIMQRAFMYRMHIYVHHRDGYKLNNDDSNLEYFCVACHASIDETHRKNFSEGSNTVILEEFLKKTSNLKQS